MNPYNPRAWGSGPKPAGWVSLPWEERYTVCPVHKRYMKYKDVYRPLCVLPGWPSSPTTCCCPTEVLRR